MAVVMITAAVIAAVAAGLPALPGWLSPT